MAKDDTKVKISISIDRDVYERLKKHCDQNLMKLSSYINYILNQHEEK